jgi:hypothetical protein
LSSLYNILISFEEKEEIEEMKEIEETDEEINRSKD